MPRLLTALLILATASPVWSEEAPVVGVDSSSASADSAPSTSNPTGEDSCSNANAEPGAEVHGLGGGTSREVEDKKVGERGPTGDYASCVSCDTPPPSPPPYTSTYKMGVAENCSVGANHQVTVTMTTGNPVAGAPAMGGCGSCGAGGGMPPPSGEMGAYRGLPLTDLFWRSRVNPGANPLMDRRHSFDVVLTQSYTASTSTTEIELDLPEGGVRPRFTTSDGQTFTAKVGHNAMYHGASCTRAGDLLTVRGVHGHLWQYTLPVGWDRTLNGLKLRPTQMQAPWAYPVTLSYDALGHLTQAQSLLGSTSFSWAQVNGLWAIVAMTGPDGRTTTFSYTQVLGRTVLSAVTHPDGSQSTFTVDPVQRNLPGYSGLFTVRRDVTPNLAVPGARVRRLWIDSLGRVPLVEDGLDRDLLWLPGSGTVSGKIWRMFQEPAGGLYMPIARAWSASSNARIYPGRDAITGHTMDGNLRLTSEIDELGRITTYTYGAASNLLASITHPDGTQESWVRQAESGRPLQYTDRLGRVTKAQRDSRGNPLQVLYPDGTPGDDSDNPRIISAYNDAAQLTHQVDEAGRETQYFYSLSGQVADAPATTSDPANHGYLVRVVRPGDTTGGSEVWTYQWDAAHQDCIAVADPQGRTTQWLYDALHRLVRTTYADGSFESWTYGTPSDAATAGLVVSSRDRNGRVTTYAYDASGTRTATVLADGTQDIVTYDVHARVATRTVAGDATSFGYDASGREFAVSRQSGASQVLTTTVERDAQNRVIASTDAYGRTSGTVYDGDGRPTRQVQGLLPGVLSWSASQAGVDGALASTTWVDTDINSPSGPAGSTTVNGGAVTLTSYGYQLVMGTDRFRFRNVPMPGEGSLTCQVTENATAQAGLVLRASLSPTAPYAGIVLQPDGRIAVIERLRSGATQENYSYAVASPAHTWLRITRTSHLAVCWSSPDGVTWTPRLVAGIPMQSTAVIGLIAAPTTGVNAWSPAWGSASYDQISMAKTSVLASVRSQAWQQYLQALPRLGGANPAYVVTDLTYDAESQLLSSTNGNGVATTFAYDPRGRLLSQSEAGATTLFAYDAVGNRTQVTSPRNVVTQMTYTQRNLPATITEAVGTLEQTVVSTRTYTATGKPATETDALGRVNISGFGGCCDRLLSITDAGGYVTSFTYDAVGNRLTVTDPLLHTTTTTYDVRNRPVTVTNATSEVTAFAYDENLTDGVGLDAVPAVAAVLPSLGLGAGADGSAVAVTDPLLHTSYELRDGLGRTVARIDPLGQASTVVYDAVVGGLVETAMSDALGHVTRARVDGAGQVRQQVDALGNVATSAFDAVGNQISQRDALGVGWDAAYDARGRLLSRTSTRQDTVATTSWTYDLDSNRLSETDALGKIETAVYDARNRRIQLTDRLNGITRFAYDAVGNLTQISDADNEVNGGLANLVGTTQYAYDVRNLLTSEAFPTGQQGRTLRVYIYDAARRLSGRQVGILDGAFSATPAFTGAVTATSYAYDAVNRLTTRGYGDGLGDGFGYDAAGRLTGATSARYATTVGRAYDAAGRLTSESLSVPDGVLSGTTLAPATWTVGYTYLNDNTLASQTYPTGSVVTRTYTNRHELATVSLGGSPVSTRTYDAAGRLSSATAGNGLVETRGYVTGDYLVASISVPGVTSFGYTYDAASRKLTETDAIATGQTFGYDDAGRLTAWTAGAAATQSWNLTTVGDWTSTTRNGVPETRVHSAVHEATQVGPNILSYDAQGNLTTDEKGTALAWDPENRLIRARVTRDASPTGFGSVAAYRYDALGRRIGKTVDDTTTFYLPAGAQTVVELDRPALPPSQADLDGATADGTLANQALAPASGGILPGAAGTITRINFQPSTTATPAGFIRDTGKTLAVRTNGLSYGWSADSTAQAVVRGGAVPLVEFDTFVQAQPDAGGANSWSIALPNGTYPVVVVAGDALSTEQTNHLDIGGVAVTDTTPSTTPGYQAGNFDGYAVEVTVTAGVLTIAPGSGAYHAKLCFVEIGQAGTAGTLITPEILATLATRVAQANAQTGANPIVRNGVREFVYGSYVDEVVAYTQTVAGVTKRYYPHYNHLYSVAALTDGTTGAVVERYTYDAYGKQKITDAGGSVVRSRSAVGWDRGFTGYIADQETGLLHARNRMYGVALGRWISRDPLGYVDGFSVYDGFGPNNLDPWGLFKCSWVVVISHSDDAKRPLDGGIGPNDACSRYDSISCRNKKNIYGKYASTPSPHGALVGNSNIGEGDVEMGDTLVSDGLVRGMADDDAGVRSKKIAAEQLANFKNKLNNMRRALYDKAVAADCCQCPRLDFYILAIGSTSGRFEDTEAIIDGLGVGEGIRTPGGNETYVPGQEAAYNRWRDGVEGPDGGFLPGSRPHGADMGGSAPAMSDFVDAWRKSAGKRTPKGLHMRWIHESYSCTSSSDNPRQPFVPW